MPRTDDPTARSLFDLLKEKYPDPPSHGTPVAHMASAGSPVSRTLDPRIDAGSRSLLLATLMALLATAFVTLSLKPDWQSTDVDTPPVVASRSDIRPTSEIGILATPTTTAPATPAGEPATVASLPIDSDSQPSTSARRSLEAQPPPYRPDVPEQDLRREIFAGRAPSRSLRPLRETALAAQPDSGGGFPEGGTRKRESVARDPVLRDDERQDVGFAIDRPQSPTAATPTEPRMAGPRIAGPRMAGPTATIDPPVKLATPLPAYTQAAWVAGVHGDVLVKAKIDAQGNVADVEVVRGLSHGLTEAAVAAVRRWKFRPASIDGEPVAADHNLSIRFTL